MLDAILEKNMKTALLILSIFLFLQTDYCFSQSEEVAENDSFIIKGKVIDSKTQENMPAVLVTLFFNRNEYVSCLCDLDGKFILNVSNREKLHKDSYLEFLFFTHRPMIINGDLKNINHLDVKMDFDPDAKMTKEEFYKLCRERYNYEE